MALEQSMSSWAGVESAESSSFADSAAYSDPSTSSGTSPPNRRDAERFIEALAGSADATVTFQTFPDNRANTGTYARVLHGTLSAHWAALKALNEQGHGIFVMVNEGSGAGRTKADVVSLRALFIDDDGKTSPVAFNNENAGAFAALAPSITVQSKAGQHNYFLLKTDEPMEHFTQAQANLAAHFGTDSAVKDLSRVMRLPGFLHMKDPSDPFLVRLVQSRTTRHTIREVLAAYPIPLKAPPVAAPVVDTMDRTSKMKRVSAYVSKVPGAVEGEGGDTATFKLCAALSRGFDLSDDECMLALAAWNERCSPPWSAAELREKIQNARKYGDEPVGGQLATKPPEARNNEFASLTEILRADASRAVAIGRAGRLEMDERTRQVMLDRKPYGEDVEIDSLREKLTRHFKPEDWKGKFEFTKDNVHGAVRLIASENSFHPVQEYLRSVRWDGVDRLSQVASRVLGLPATDRWDALNTALLKRWFVSAVARAMEPGCKVDTVLIFVGKQGVRKSTFFSVLGGEWFSDAAVDMENKDGLLLLGKTWILELAELDSMTRARNQAAVKAFLSKRIDEYRPPYGRNTITVPRSSVFVGTTNEDDFLTDTTGNRRYWPISGIENAIDTELLSAWRDQLWAQAMSLFAKGEQWHLTDEEEEQLTEKLQEHQRLDAWHETIAAFVEQRQEVSAGDVLTHLQISVDRRTRADDMRVASTLKALNFRSARRSGAKRERVWMKNAA